MYLCDVNIHVCCAYAYWEGIIGMQSCSAAHLEVLGKISKDYTWDN